MRRARRPVMMSIGALAIVLGFQNCDFIGGPMGQALRSLAGGSSLPDGVYGISPTALQLKDSRRGTFSNLVVRSTGSGTDKILNTTFDTGNITGLKANTTYFLDVRGISGSTGKTETPLANYSITTWDTFASGSLKIAANDAADSTSLSLNGSANVISWTYAPWTKTPPGDGVLDNTLMQCFFVQDQGPNTDPFVAGATSVSGPAGLGRLPFTTADVKLSGNVRIGCQIVYADKTISKSAMTVQTLLLPSVGKCPGSTLTVYKPYTCAITDVAGASATSAGLTFSLDTTNTCSFLTVQDNALSGTPRDPSVGTCTLAFKLSSNGISSPVISQQMTVNNAKAVWVGTPPVVTPLQETSRHDPGALTGTVIVPESLRSNTTYVLHMADKFQTNKAAFGAADGATYGAYKLDTTTASNCGRFGTFTYPDASGKYVSGINPKTGEFYFQPYEYVWGSCTVDVFFDDGHATDNRSDNLQIPVKILGYDDPPEVRDPGFPKTGVGGSELYDCGSNCYIGIDYTLTLQANTGGINTDHPDISGEPDQKLFMKPGNCIAFNSNPNDQTPYVAINFCELDPKTGNILIGFQPMSLPPTGTQVLIAVVATDNGARGPSMGSAYNPNPSGTNTNCLSPDKSVCKEYPNSNMDSDKFIFTLQVDKFNLPIQPALIVSKGACISCHLTITSGDFVTDIGNTPKGTVSAGRFLNQFFTGGDFTSSATHIEGYRSINQLNGNLYVKRATISSDVNPKFFQRVTNIPTFTTSKGATGADLATFMTTWNWMLDGARYSDTYVNQNNSFASVCGPNPNVGDDGTKTCQPAPVRDTVVKNGQTVPINYLTISAPTVNDIMQISRLASGAANQINWLSGNAEVAPLYIVPTDPNVPARPFSGLVVSTTQPEKAGGTTSPPTTVTNSYVTNKGIIQCYGDVAVKGDLYLEQPSFVSDGRGCRIHVTGSVIIHSPAGTSPEGAVQGSSVTGSGNVGVQITSAVAVALGFSQAEGASRGLPEGTLAAERNLMLPATMDCMQGGSPVAFKADGSCPAGATANNDSTAMPGTYSGWNWGYVNFEGLMLNAPVVQGRYQGKITGSIIADYALFRLGHLDFAFDARFTGQVPFPRLQTIKSSLGNNPRVIFDAGPCLGTGSDSWQCNESAVQ